MTLHVNYRPRNVIMYAGNRHLCRLPCEIKWQSGGGTNNDPSKSCIVVQSVKLYQGPSNIYELIMVQAKVVQPAFFGPSRAGAGIPPPRSGEKSV